MAENDLKVILKAKELAEHTLRVTSNCNRYPKKYRFSLVDNCIKLCHSMDMLVKEEMEKYDRVRN